MIKYKIFFNYEKEEKWLEKMSQQGYILKKKGIGYHFIKKDSESTVIRIDYRRFNSMQDFLDYCALFEDCGWQHIAGTKSSGEQYFKKIRSDSNDDIFSDAFSKAGRYKRVSNMCLNLSVCFIPFLVELIRNAEVDIAALMNPKEWYLTPGLWELDGLSFWQSFLFETPFAVLRGCSWLIGIIFMFIYIIIALKYYILYKSAMNSNDVQKN